MKTFLMRLAMSAPFDVHVDVTLRGLIPARSRDYAAEKIGAMVRLAPFAVLHATVTLTRTRHRALDRRVVAEANLDVNGRPVRAQVAAASSYEAIDLMRDRLRRKLSQLGRHPCWHSGRRRAHHPGYEQRPIAQREVVARKAFTAAVASLDEAIFDLEMMDYDFQLFTDARCGVDSVVYRAEPGYRITRLDAKLGDLPQTGVAVRVDGWSALRLTLQAAQGVLDASDLPFVFYADPVTGRGNVLYRRHDGHYGLITPAV